MKLSDLALRVAALKTLADDVSAALTAAKAALLESMDEAGADRTSAKLPSGTKVASLPLAGGEPKAKVTDPVVLLAWAREAHPEEIVTTVNPEFVKKLLDASNADGRAVDPSTGEVVPGIEFRLSSPYVSVNFARTTPDGGGRDAIRAAWRGGELSISDMLALPAGDDQ